jgi:hypothetical protein
VSKTQSVPEISTETSRLSTVAQDNESSLYKNGSWKSFCNKLKPFFGVPETIGLEVSLQKERILGILLKEIRILSGLCE